MSQHLTEDCNHHIYDADPTCRHCGSPVSVRIASLRRSLETAHSFALLFGILSVVLAACLLIVVFRSVG